MSFISARSEHQSVSEVFCNKDSESRRFQFDQGIYPRLSQSTVWQAVFRKVAVVEEGRLVLDKLDLFFNWTLGNCMNKTTSQNLTACFFYTYSKMKIFNRDPVDELSYKQRCY